MDKDNFEPVDGAPGEKVIAEVIAEEDRENEPRGALDSPSGDGRQVQPWLPQSTVLTLQDLLDLPGQIIPAETYRHLRNAGREAILAIVSLVGGINNARRGPEDGKIRRHIDVE
ncbi:MAG: hypothetical protein ACJ78Q_18195 [Chloroflexia bacterium]